jgi:diguanylate cyclase (GGDEF)-like protein
MRMPTANEAAGPAATGNQTAVDCYLATFMLLGRYSALLWPHEGAAYQEELVRLRKRLAFEPRPEALEHSLRELERDTEAFERKAAAVLQARDKAMAELIKLAANAADDFELRDQFYLEQLTTARGRIEADLTRKGDQHLRQALNRYLEELRRFTAAMARDGESVFAAFRRQTRAIAEGLEEAGADPALDRLTGLASRMVLERQIRERIESGAQFCLLLFDVRELRVVNQHFGKEGGDSVLRQFGHRLVSHVRPRDVVARWGGDEFGVIFDCPLEAATARSHEIAQWMAGRYRFLSRTREWKAEIEATALVIEHQPAESFDDFLSRANSLTQCGSETGAG